MKYDRDKGCYPIPISINISITERCPLKCPICFQTFNNNAELGLDIVRKYLDELSLLGTKFVQFSGGEPLMNPQLLQMIYYAKEKGMKTRISTSGVGLTNSIAKQLVNVGLDVCHISLNGSTKSIHELTRMGFDETMKALGILANVGMPIAINWVANHVNIYDLPNMIELAKIYNVEYISILSNKSNNSKEILYPVLYEDICALKKIYLENKDFLLIESCFYEVRDLIKGNKVKSIDEGCRAGRFYMAISAKNEFSPCPHIHTKQKKEMSIEDYWNNDENLNLLRNKFKNSIYQKEECCIPCLKGV